MVRLELRRQGAQRLVLSLPLRVRLLPAIVSGWLLYALAGAIEIPAGGPRIAALALLAMAAGAALYDDRWLFDLEQHKVLRRRGLLFAARETTVAVDDLAAVELSGGRGPAARAELSLRTRDGRFLRLEQLHSARAGELLTDAAEISMFCGIPLEDGTE
jgi:hypothetical protein